MKRNIGILVFLMLMSSLLAQQEIRYYGVNGKILESADQAIQRLIIEERAGNRIRVIKEVKINEQWIHHSKEFIRMRNDGTQIIRRFHDTFFPRSVFRKMTKLEEGDYYFTELSGRTLRREGSSSSEYPLHLSGSVIEYYKDGGRKSKSLYQDNMLISNKNWLPDGSAYINNIFYSTDSPPMLPYDPNFIRNYMVGKIAESKIPVHEIQDEVLIGAVVMETGELTGLRILKGRVESINTFLINALEELPGKWEPAELNGKKVRSFISFPINFSNTTPSLQNFELTKGGQIFWSD